MSFQKHNKTDKKRERSKSLAVGTLSFFAYITKEFSQDSQKNGDFPIKNSIKIYDILVVLVCFSFGYLMMSVDVAPLLIRAAGECL
ncbi:hypothetical protein QYG89_10760 [Bacillus sp. B190/17]|uniref:Uncharacterized protein n=1 Tax=Bacillus lumedeiriae TaxID=3058829 RepID=A0ABW8IAG7_9BACI